MMDEELLPINENAQSAVPVPEYLDQKFPISKKEVTVQDKYVIGAEFLRFDSSGVKKNSSPRKKEQAREETMEKEKLLLEECFNTNEDGSGS